MVKEGSDVLKMDRNALATYLTRMQATGAVEKRISFNGNKKNIYYEISDPFIRFYYKLIYPNLLNIECGLGRNVFQLNASSIEDFIDHGFEDTVISYLDERNQKGMLPTVFHPFQNYKVDNSKLGRPIEIDAISDSLDKRSLIAGEVKFRNKDVSLEKLDHLKENVSIFKNNYRNIYYFLFSKTSFSKELLVSKDSSIVLISLDEMMDSTK